MKKTFLVSDLHLNYWDEARAEAFAAFLAFAGEEAKTLIINGDLFDLPPLPGETFWPRNAPGLTALLDLVRRRRVRVYYLAGNHDYPLQDLGFREALFSTFDPYLELRIGTHSYHIEHGHRYDPLFESHLYTELDVFEDLTGVDLGESVEALLRAAENDLRAGRGPGRVLEDLVREIFLIWKHRRRLAQSPPLLPIPEVLLPIWQRAAAIIRREEGVDYVVFGHTHHPSPPVEGYLNSGDWVRHRTYVVLDESGPLVREWPEKEA